MKNISYEDKSLFSLGTLIVVYNLFNNVWIEGWPYFMFQTVIFGLLNYSAWAFYKYHKDPFLQWRWYNKLWFALMIISSVSIPVATIMELLGMSTKLF